MLTELQNKRKKHNYSLQAMANKLHISKTYYWQLEQDNRRLPYDLAVKMATVLHCTTDELFANYYMENLELKGERCYVNEVKKNKKAK